MPATADAVPTLRTAVTRFALRCGVPEPPLEDMRLAVSEAVANVVMHGYRDREEPGPVEVQAELADEGLRLVVADEGTGMHPRPDSPGGGFGLPLIGAVTDEFEIRAHRPTGTELCLFFRLAA
jgi:serine/threonine-protein kinase RsbW/stage II sporulation protein AB (anti-sigma F factor)